MDSLTVTSPCGVVNAVKTVFTFEWNIKDFTTICDKVKSMKFLRSPIFPTSIGQQHNKCYIKLFPNGDTLQNKGYLWVYIQYVNQDGVEETVNKDGVARTTVQFNLLNANNQVYATVSTSKDTKLLKGVRLLDQNTVLTRSNGILRDGSITIQCEITEETNTDYENLALDMQKLTRLKEFDGFEMLLGNKEHSDVFIIVENKKIPAHKCILSAKSSVFAAMFQHEMMENKENVVEIEDIKFEVMKELLRFLYVGKVGDIGELALDLYKAADKYSLDNLKDISEQVMCQNLSITNIWDYVHFTSFYEAMKLKAAAIDFIRLHSEELKPIC